MDGERIRGVIRGDVQGVGFRFYLVKAAQALGLRGWVRNRSDGTVEFIAEGPRPELERLLRSARQGPRGAHVTDVDVDWSPASGGLERFELSY